MDEDNARVPALLLCGGTMGARDTAIARLVEPAAPGQSIALLRSGTGMFASQATPLGPHVVVKRAPLGCVCCTGNAMFRVTLFNLLRTSRAARLVVELEPGTHVATLEAQLQSGSLARVMRVVGRVDLDTDNAATVSWPK